MHWRKRRGRGRIHSSTVEDSRTGGAAAVRKYWPGRAAKRFREWRVRPQFNSENTVLSTGASDLQRPDLPSTTALHITERKNLPLPLISQLSSSTPSPPPIFPGFFGSWYRLSWILNKIQKQRLNVSPLQSCNKPSHLTQGHASNCQSFRNPPANRSE